MKTLLLITVLLICGCKSKHYTHKQKLFREAKIQNKMIIFT